MLVGMTYPTRSTLDGLRQAQAAEDILWKQEYFAALEVHISGDVRPKD